MDCIFCKIVRNESPSYKVYEDDDVVAFLDLHPVNPGHTLLIPKAHYADFMETPEELYHKLFTTAKKVARGITQATGAQGFNLSVNNGKAAGQIIFHLHLHIIPRLVSDHVQPWRQLKYTGDEAEMIARAIREKIS